MTEETKERAWAFTRLVVAVVTVANYGLSIYGWSPLPFTEDTIYPIASAVAMLCALVWTWWQNNNVTDNAIQAQEYLDKLNVADDSKHGTVD